MLTHGNPLANPEQVRNSPGQFQEAGDVSFWRHPLFHIFGLNRRPRRRRSTGSTVPVDRAFRPVVGHRGHPTPRRHLRLSGPPTIGAPADQPGRAADAMATVRIATSGARPPDEVARKRSSASACASPRLGSLRPPRWSPRRIGLPDAPLRLHRPAHLGRVDAPVDPGRRRRAHRRRGEVRVKGPERVPRLNDAEAPPPPSPRTAGRTGDAWSTTTATSSWSTEGPHHRVGLQTYPAEGRARWSTPPSRWLVVGVAHPHP